MILTPKKRLVGILFLIILIVSNLVYSTEINNELKEILSNNVEPGKEGVSDVTPTDDGGVNIGSGETTNTQTGETVSGNDIGLDKDGNVRSLGSGDLENEQETHQGVENYNKEDGETIIQSTQETQFRSSYQDNQIVNVQEGFEVSHEETEKEERTSFDKAKKVSSESEEGTTQIDGGSNGEVISTKGPPPSTEVNIEEGGYAEAVSSTTPNKKPVSILNVPEKTKIIDKENSLEIIPDKNNRYTIMDQGGNAVIADVLKGKKLIIAKDPEPEYIMENGTILILPQYGLVINATADNANVRLSKRGDNDVYLTGKDIFLQYLTRGMKETLRAKGKSIVRANKIEGIYYAELGSPSRMSFGSGEDYFSLYRDENHTDPFYLVINKPSYKMSFKDFKDTYKTLESGLIDLENNMIHLQGDIDYEVLKDNQEIAKLIESHNQDNIINLNLDNNLIDNMTVENKYYLCKSEEILLRTNNYEYTIVEICNPKKEKVERYISFIHNNYPNKIKNYMSFFGEEHSPLVFTGKLLMIKKESSSSMFVEKNLAKQFYLSEMKKYNELFSECTNFRDVNTFFDAIV